jgi:hypothetical protein
VASDEDDRPWEQPGAFRLDCEPHRGDMLFFLARLSISLSCVALRVQKIGSAATAARPRTAFSGQPAPSGPLGRESHCIWPGVE